MKDLKKHYNSIVFLSYFTIQPERDYINDYVGIMASELLGDGSQVWLIGKMTDYIAQDGISSDVEIFNSIPHLVEKI